MKRKICRPLIVLIALAMILSMSACGTGAQSATSAPQASNTSSGAQTSQAVQSSEAQASAQAGEKVTVTVWSGYPESSQESCAKAFYRVLEKAKTDMPNITIEHDGTENEAYKTKIKTAIAANEAPDVFFAWGAGFLKPFVDAGKILPLDEYISDVKEKFLPGATDYFTYDNKLYALPTYKWVAVLYCNKELFDKNGIKLPDTYDDLLAAVKAFNAKGITPITVGEKDKWVGMFWQNAFAVRTAGARLCNQALNKQASFDQQAFIGSAAKLKELVDNNAFLKGCMGLTYDEGNVPFLQGQAAMYLMGDWFAGIAESADSQVKGKVAVKKFPSIGNSDEDEWLGGAVDCFAVNNDTKNKEAALTVAKYISEGMAKDLAATGEGIPAWKVPAATGDVNPVIKQITELCSTGRAYMLAWNTFLEGADADTHEKLVADIFGGKVTPEIFAKGMQKLNEAK